MLFVNVFILVSLLESAHSGVISYKADIDKDSEMGIDPFVEQDIDDILQQMEEDGESMLELMLEEDSEAMLEDAERVERSVGELFNRIFSLIPVPLYPQAFPVDELSLDPVGVVEYFAPASALQVRNYYEEQKSLAEDLQEDSEDAERVKRSSFDDRSALDLFNRLYRASPLPNIALGPFLSLQPLAFPVNGTLRNPQTIYDLVEDTYFAVVNTTAQWRYVQNNMF